jgi:hypothetical protein
MKIRSVLYTVLFAAGTLLVSGAKSPADNPEWQIRELEEKANGATDGK